MQMFQVCFPGLWLFLLWRSWLFFFNCTILSHFNNICHWTLKLNFIPNSIISNTLCLSFVVIIQQILGKSIANILLDRSLLPLLKYTQVCALSPQMNIYMYLFPRTVWICILLYHNFNIIICCCLRLKLFLHTAVWMYSFLSTSLLQ